MQTLQIRSQYDNQLISELVHEDEHTILTWSEPGIAVALNRIIKDGLSRWVGDRSDPVSEFTLSTDLLFLPRLAEYLRLQFNFLIILSES